MLDQQGSAAETVAIPLFKAEQDLDDAIASAAGLIVHLLEIRAKAKLPAMIGQQTLESLGAAVTTLIQSRREMIETHAGLEQADEQIALRTSSIGNLSAKPAAGRAREDVTQGLRLVK